MHPNDFTAGIVMITETFGEAPTKGPRLGRIKAFSEGRISGEGFIEVCEGLCDHFRFAPLPGDFEKGINDWRKRYFQQHGRPYAENPDIIDVQYTAFDCGKCNDLGVVRITHRVPSRFESLMRCGCGKVSADQVTIPEWDPGLSGAYIPEPCPVNWFKPDIQETDSDAKIYSKIWDRVEFWKSKQQKAIEHWASLGFGNSKVHKST